MLQPETGSLKHNNIEAIRFIPAPDVDNYEDVVKQWDGFIQGIEKKVEEKVGPPTGTSVRGGAFFILL